MKCLQKSKYYKSFDAKLEEFVKQPTKYCKTAEEIDERGKVAVQVALEALNNFTNIGYTLKFKDIPYNLHYKDDTKKTIFLSIELLSHDKVHEMEKHINCPCKVSAKIFKVVAELLDIKFVDGLINTLPQFRWEHGGSSRAGDEGVASSEVDESPEILEGDYIAVKQTVLAA